MNCKIQAPIAMRECGCDPGYMIPHCGGCGTQEAVIQNVECVHQDRVKVDDQGGIYRTAYGLHLACFGFTFMLHESDTVDHNGRTIEGMEHDRKDTKLMSWYKFLPSSLTVTVGVFAVAWLLDYSMLESVIFSTIVLVICVLFGPTEPHGPHDGKGDGT